ncbi:MAG: hypothetical protein M0R32_09615 [Candidatus Cloacimonetes bacterium]|nr:hypothetical protein [Candidatus Cloacimonadota bacterium]
MINAQMIQKALQTKKPTSLTTLWAALGNKSKPGQSARAQITAAMPNILEELNKVKAAVAAQAKAPAPKAPKPAKVQKSKVHKAPKAKVQKSSGTEQVKSEWLEAYAAKEKGNPYLRKRSLYAAMWDSVKANPGKSAEFHIAKLAKLSGKEDVNVGTAFTVVIASAETAESRKARGNTRTCNRHASCKDGYTVTATSTGGALTWAID